MTEEQKLIALKIFDDGVVSVSRRPLGWKEYTFLPIQLEVIRAALSQPSMEDELAKTLEHIVNLCAEPRMISDMDDIDATAIEALAQYREKKK